MKDAKYVSVDRVLKIEGKGPWPTKSGGQLDMLFGLPFEQIQDMFFSYNQKELDELPRDIRGLRAYSVRGLKEGSVGAGEWHKVRSELVFAISGAAEWSCEDMHGNEKTLRLERGSGVFTPSFILHTYKALEDDTRLLVISNTVFDADDEATKDSYPAETFKFLQAKLSGGMAGNS